MAATRTLAVVTAGISTPSGSRTLGDGLATATVAAARQITGMDTPLEVEVIELRPLATELALATTQPAASTPRVDEARRIIAAADGLIAISPVFQGSYTGVFKMFFDALDVDALRDVPTLIGATGGSVRHLAILDYAMRPLLSFMHANVLPMAIFQATADFGTADGLRLASRIEAAGAQLAAAIFATHAITGTSNPASDTEAEPATPAAAASAAPAAAAPASADDAPVTPQSADAHSQQVPAWAADNNSPLMSHDGALTAFSGLASVGRPGRTAAGGVAAGNTEPEPQATPTPAAPERRRSSGLDVDEGYTPFAQLLAQYE